MPSCLIKHQSSQYIFVKVIFLDFWLKTATKVLSEFAICPTDCGLASPHNCVSQFLKINLHTSTHALTFHVLFHSLACLWPAYHSCSNPQDIAQALSPLACLLWSIPSLSPVFLYDNLYVSPSHKTVLFRAKYIWLPALSIWHLNSLSWVSQDLGSDLGQGSPWEPRLERQNWPVATRHIAEEVEKNRV